MVFAAREFEHNNKDITDSAQYFTDLSEYLDTRLTELFSQEAYIGMMADIEITTTTSWSCRISK